MIVITLALIGFWLGWTRAGRAGGDRKDRWQWGAGHGFALGLVGIILTVLIERMI